MSEAADKALKEDEQLYYVDVYIEHNFEYIQALSNFLKDNGYEYKVNSKGKVSNI